ncbi:MAG TPA: response regulator transcription factor [Anaerolineaceae bacterium]
MIKVAIVDDHNLVRQGIRAILEKSADIQVIGEASDGQQAIELVQELAPDVMVMDIVMPRLNGTQVLDRLKSMKVNTRVVVLSMYSDETLIFQILHRGAKGYLLKRSVTEELLLAIRSAYQNEIYLSPEISSVVLADVLSNQPKVEERSAFEALTPREREVLQLIAEGHTNAAIAQKMYISEKTVEKHRASLMDKLNIHDMVGLIRFAIKNGLISLDE